MKHLLYLLAEHLFFLYTPSALCHFSVFQALKVKVAHLCPTLCDPWAIQSMEFSRPEYWSE